MDERKIPAVPPYEASAYEIMVADLRRLVALLRRHRLVLIALVVSGTAVGVALALVWPKTYRAETILVPVSDQSDVSLAGVASQFSNLASLAGLDVGRSQMTEEALALLRSRGFLEAYIADKNLLPVLFEDEWDASAGAWLAEDPDDVPTLWDGFDLFRDEVLGIENNRSANVVTVSIDWQDPELAAVWANELIGRLNETMRQRAVEESDKSLKFLEEALKSTNLVGLQEAISRLMEAQLRAAMVARVRPEYAFNVIDVAHVPDGDDYRWPNRPLFVAAGFLFGMFLGIGYAFLRGAPEPGSPP